MTPDLDSYDHILVAFSGGKDSLACVLDLLDRGVPRAKIELHHHDVDGHGQTFMDWGCTRAYCQAFADAFGLPMLFSYKVGGFLGEMNRDDTPTAPIRFDTPDGQRETGGRGPAGTRGKFPQVAADLSVRWCSAYLKIDVLAAAIRNQERFKGKRVLVVTGERAQESAARSRYKEFEPHRTHVQSRHVDHWRPVLRWEEAQVWGVIRAHGVVPHIAYQLGWSRLSCMTCIFGSPDQWRTIQVLFPTRFAQIARREMDSGKTIQRSASVHELAERGTPFPAALANPHLWALAEADAWTLPIRVPPESWTLPAGAFGEGAGPT